MSPTFCPIPRFLRMSSHTPRLIPPGLHVSHPSNCHKTSNQWNIPFRQIHLVFHPSNVQSRGHTYPLLISISTPHTTDGHLFIFQHNNSLSKLLCKYLCPQAYHPIQTLYKCPHYWRSELFQLFPIILILSYARFLAFERSEIRYSSIVKFNNV